MAFLAPWRFKLMKNIVTATIHFSFKGINHSPSITIELDKHLQSTRKIPDLHPLIAKENNFDLYSYEYEMMQAEDITFSNAEGLIKNFILDGILDTEAFETNWKENNILEMLATITERHMGINDLTQHPELKNALLNAYNIGKLDSK